MAISKGFTSKRKGQSSGKSIHQLIKKGYTAAHIKNSNNPALKQMGASHVRLQHGKEHVPQSADQSEQDTPDQQQANP